jgi:arylsulfatase A-like enzyme
MLRNLIIICPDEMRGDCAGYAENPVIRTPNVDALARRGVVFDNHFTVMPKCVPARVSLMTGRYTHTDGYRTVSQVMNPGEDDLLARFTAAEYQTALFGKDHCWGAERVERDFDFTSHAGPLAHHMEGVPALSDHRPSEGGAAEFELESGWHYVGARTRHVSDDRKTDQAVAFLTGARDRSRPFFMQVNIESPHPVYGVEEPWFSMYATEELNRWPSALPTGAPLPLRAQREVRTSSEDVERESAEIQRVYYGMISNVDVLVGRILDAIESEGLWDDTVVLFWSDHGDYAGQYGLAEKWDTSFADCLVKVPCILVAPGTEPRRVAALTETTDLAPTLARLLDLPPLPRAHGEDLGPVIAGSPGKEAVFADGGHEREMRERFPRQHPVGGATYRTPAGLKRSGKSETYSRYPASMARARMVRTHRYKMVVRETHDNELYDLDADPFEMENLWSAESASDGSNLAGVKLDLAMRLNEFALRTDTDEPYLEEFTV